MPRPWSERTSPSVPSTDSARRTVWRFTPNRSASAGSAGSASPADHAPPWISDRRRSAIWRHRAIPSLRLKGCAVAVNRSVIALSNASCTVVYNTRRLDVKTLDFRPSLPEDRPAVLALLARTEPGLLADAWRAIDDKPDVEIVREPEFALVMARGRIGGGGAPFNLGEVTVTRAMVRLASGEGGHGHVLGRDRQRAWLVACLDALWQNPRHRPAVIDAALRPALTRANEADAKVATETAATRVNFFTLVRGEDEE